jgi:tetratricopeptide (TPR) repeat protein
MGLGEAILHVVLSLIMLGSICVRTAAQDASRAEQLAEQASQLAQSGHPKQAEAMLRRAAALAPADARVLTTLGGVLGMEGKLSEASTYFEKALKIDPTSVSIRRDLAATQWQRGQWDRARRNLEVILRTKPEDPPSILLLGMVAVNTKDYKSAARLLASVPALVRQRPESIAALVRSYYKIGDTAKAREVLMSLLNRPVSPKAVLLGAEMAEEAKDFETAARMFESIQSNYPKQAALTFDVARVRYEAGDYGRSQTLLEHLIRDGTATSEIYNLLGGCHEKQHQADKAIKALEMAISLKPSQEANYRNLTNILIAQKNPTQALAIAKKWAGRFPSSSLAYASMAEAQMHLMFYKDAVSSYKQAVEMNPSSKEAILGLGRAESSAGFTTQAEAVFEKGIHRFPQDAALYEECGGMLLKQAVAGDPEAQRRAVLLLETSIRLDSSDWHAQYLLGNFWLGQGKDRKALRYLTEAVHLAPKQSEVHFALWRAYRKMGLSKQAAQEMIAFQELRKAASARRARADAN